MQNIAEPVRKLYKSLRKIKHKIPSECRSGKYWGRQLNECNINDEAASVRSRLRYDVENYQV